MGWLEQTEHALRRALFEVTAIDAPRPILKPLVDLEIADLSSELCLYASKRLNRPPSEITQQVLEAASPQIDGEVSTLRGYINIRGPRRLDWLNKVESPSSHGGTGSMVLVARGTEVATVRLLARAALQIKLDSSLGAVFLLSAQGLERLEFDRQKWSDCWHQHCMLAIGRETLASTRAVQADINLGPEFSGARSVTLWTESSLLRSSNIKAVISVLRQRAIETRLAVVPNRWGADSRFRASQLLSPDDPRFNLARLVYLAGNLFAAELDTAVPTLIERANTISMLRATSSRLNALASGAAVSLSTQDVSSELVARILLRCRFLPIFVRNAGSFGEVGELIAVLDDLCGSFQSYFNRPETRQRLVSNRPDPELNLVMSGVHDALAYILTLLEDEPGGD